MKALLSLLFSVICSSLLASTGCEDAVWIPPGGYLLPIKISIDGPQPTAGRAESYLRDKLRETQTPRGRVTFRDDEAPFTLKIVLSRIQDTNGLFSGYSLSALATCNPTVSATPAEGAQAENTSVVGDWSLQGAPEELQSLCEKIASEFDQKVLGPERKKRESIKEDLIRAQK